MFRQRSRDGNSRTSESPSPRSYNFSDVSLDGCRNASIFRWDEISLFMRLLSRNRTRSLLFLDVHWRQGCAGGEVSAEYFIDVMEAARYKRANAQVQIVPQALPLGGRVGKRAVSCRTVPYCSNREGSLWLLHGFGVASGEHSL